LFQRAHTLARVCVLSVGLLGAAAPVSAQDRQDAVRDRDQPDEPGERAMQAAAESELDRDGWAALPLASYAPETHVGLGAFGIYFFRMGSEPATTRPSSVALVGLYTTRHQAIVELIPELYMDDERWHVWSKLDFRSFPDSFWGVGPDTPAMAEERYDQVSYRFRNWIRRNVTGSFYVGMYTDAQRLSVTEVERNGIFDTEDVPGENGGWTVGTGVTVGWDTRDNAVDTRHGSFYQARLMQWSTPLGSDYNFTRLALDLRQFVQIVPGHALGFQVYGEMNLGNVPFYHMALLGGQNLMRGYFEGRYRDHDMLAAQTEYRFPIWWRFRGVAFVAAGDVADRITNLDPTSLEVAGGAGIRFSLNEQERLNVRVDVGVGIDTWGAYLGISEAF